MQLRKTIHALVASNKLDEALNLIELYAQQINDENLLDTIIILVARQKNLKSEELKGLLGREEKGILTNSIRSSILELSRTIEEPKIIEKKFQDELDKINIRIQDKKGTLNFTSWFEMKLMDFNILAPFFLVATSIFYLFRWLIYDDIQNFLYCGIITNFLITIAYLVRPLRKHINKSFKDGKIDLSKSQKEKLKVLLDIETDYGLQNAYSRALKELKRFDKYWYFVWVGWAGLYLYWIFSKLILASNHWLLSNYYFQALEPILNGISSLFILFSFFILYFKRENKKSIIKWMFIFTAVFGLSIIFLFNSHNVNNLTPNYDIVNGIFAGLAIALLSGRLDSKFLKIPFWIIVALYFYALIQYSITDFEDDVFIKAINITLALLAKTLLITLFAWLTGTNRLLYYLIVANKKEEDVK